MSDWPTVQGGRLPHNTVSAYGDRCGLATGFNGAAAGVVSATFPSANRAFFYPIVLDAPFTAVRMYWYNGTAASGNVDAGIYDAVGTLLASIGSTGQSGTSALQSAALTASAVLQPGSYYLAIALNNTTGALFRAAPPFIPFVMGGMASAFPLPATATIGVAGFDYLPMMGMSARSIP